MREGKDIAQKPAQDMLVDLEYLQPGHSASLVAECVSDIGENPLSGRPTYLGIDW